MLNKFFYLILLLSTSYNCIAQDSFENCDSVTVAAEKHFLEEINEHDPFFLIKLTFGNKTQVEKITMVPEITLRGELKEFYKVDSLNFQCYIDSIIKNHVNFPLQDTVNFKCYVNRHTNTGEFISIDQNLLNSLNSVSLKGNIDKYFDSISGLLKSKYQSLFGWSSGIFVPRITLANYLFDHYIIFEFLNTIGSKVLIWKVKQIIINKCLEKRSLF